MRSCATPVETDLEVHQIGAHRLVFAAGRARVYRQARRIIPAFLKQLC